MIVGLIGSEAFLRNLQTVILIRSNIHSGQQFDSSLDTFTSLFKSISKKSGKPGSTADSIAMLSY
jgi:hypothetical protein